jgi:DNA polymerase III subunit gamma/tau
MDKVAGMAFQSLYRKHRPQSFGELVGQEAVSTALRNAVREGRVGHAYLFSGPRGTGKTTTARLLAKALNCPNRGSDGEPCNTCPSCIEIAAGTSMDVVELDAASNRGVSEMRALLERVAYRSAGGARKVYIVDEVHMLTKEASATLLKTLEEPPGHVIFVLATTDPQMVPLTIRSRTQHFEFSLLPAAQLAAHLADVARREGVEADPEALATLARRAGGSARDALSLLDQALAYGEGRLVPDQVAALFGGTPFGQRSAVVEAMAAGDVAGLLERLDGLLGAGVDARQLADDLLRYLREVFVVSSSRGRVRVEAPEEERAQLVAQGEAMGAATVVRALESLGEAALEIRRAPDPRLVLEVALVRLARRDVTTVEALAERLGRLERAVDDLRATLAGGGSPPAAGPRHERAVPAEPAGRPPGPKAALGALRGHGTPPPAEPATAVPPPPPPPAAAPPPSPAARTGPAESLDLDDVILAWPDALAGFKPRLKAMAGEAQPVRVEGDVVVLGLPSRFERVHLPTIVAESSVVAEALARRLGRPLRVRVELDDGLALSGDRGGGLPGPAEAQDLSEEVAVPEPSEGGGGVDSPVGLVIKTFGATVESETVREG